MAAASDLLATARQLSWLQAPDVPPFHLYLNLRFGRLASGSAEGTYLWISGPGGRWRREMKFSGFELVEVGAPREVWRKRNLDFMPKSASWTQTLLANHALVLLDGESINRLYRSVGRRCVDLRGQLDWRSLCFDSTGTLHSVTYRNAHVIYSYSDYQDFGNKRFPHTLRVIAHDTTVVEARVQDLAWEESPYPGLFKPPPGTSAVAGCMNPTPARLISGKPPDYPQHQPIVHRYGSVSLDVRIGKDGGVGRVIVTETVDPALDNAALKAVQQWRYAPFSCDGVPIVSELEVTINFLTDPEAYSPQFMREVR